MFYDLSKEKRVKKVQEIEDSLKKAFAEGEDDSILELFSDDDLYIRKTAYLGVGKIYSESPNLHISILKILDGFIENENELVRQTVINSAGEIGKTNFETVEHFFDVGMGDAHYKVRNAVIGSLKKMSQKNPKPVLHWANKYLHHDDKEIRRQVCHGIELRGRTHPQDILPLLKELQFEKTKRVRDTLIHVLGQISYKKGCLPFVIKELNTWTNKPLIEDAITEIIDVHSPKRYEKFSALSQEEAVAYIEKHIK